MRSGGPHPSELHGQPGQVTRLGGVNFPHVNAWGAMATKLGWRPSGDFVHFSDSPAPKLEHGGNKPGEHFCLRVSFSKILRACIPERRTSQNPSCRCGMRSYSVKSSWSFTRRSLTFLVKTVLFANRQVEACQRLAYFLMRINKAWKCYTPALRLTNQIFVRSNYIGSIV